MNNILERAERVMRESVVPVAQAMDAKVEVLRAGMIALEREGLLSLRRPAIYGGPDVDQATFRHFQETIARFSGSLAFLQTQHQSAVAMIAAGEHEALKASILPLAHTLDGTIGIGFSQLRRPGPPTMRAAQSAGGYVLDGHVPWVTGATFFPRFLVGAELPDGTALFAVVPLSNIVGQISVSAPMRLAAMEAAQTVTVDFTEFFVGDEDVAFVKPRGWIHDNDMVNVTLQGYFALGCAQAGIDIVRQVHGRRAMDFLEQTASSLEAELVECRQELGMLDRPLSERLESRSRAIDLAARCAHAGVVASSGAANSIFHPAQRVYREALVFSVSAQTTPIMEASLRRLVARGGP